jgi:hypothetical protein
VSGKFSEHVRRGSVIQEPYISEAKECTLQPCCFLESSGTIEILMSFFFCDMVMITVTKLASVHCDC